MLDRKKALKSGRSTYDHHNPAIYLLKLENKSSSESAMIITGQRD